MIILALLLDSLLGDPRRLPHPVRLIGWLAIRAESLCRRVIRQEKGAGIAALIMVLALTTLGGRGLIRGAALVHPLAGDLASVLILYFCFAARDLVAHSSNVARALHENDLVEARRRVGMIVGRDTEHLNESGVVRACVESVAENTVDGITAPLFWAVIGGPLGALLYKAVNTLDSTFGYRNARYLHFGWAAARLDDLANWLPARMTGLVMVPAALVSRLSAADSWRIFRRDRHRHSSPNSGQSEAAMAGALGIQLGGSASYFSRPVTKPTIGDGRMLPAVEHIDRANRLLIATTALMAIILLSARFLGVHMFT